MTIKEFNKDFLPKIDHAEGFIHNLNHAMQKTDNYEEAMNQLKCIGWSEELQETIYKALTSYKNSVLKNEVDMQLDSKFKVGDRIYHLVYGFGTILGNRHKRHNGLYYWHIQYDDGTFGYGSESKLVMEDEIEL